jgi:hypothetical protein
MVALTPLLRHSPCSVDPPTVCLSMCEGGKPTYDHQLGVRCVFRPILIGCEGGVVSYSAAIMEEDKNALRQNKTEELSQGGRNNKQATKCPMNTRMCDNSWDYAHRSH